MKEGLKPSCNLLLLRNIVYRMIYSKKQFLTLLEVSSDLLLTLSAPYDEVPDSMLRLLHDINELKVTQPHIRQFDTQQLPCPRDHSGPCGIYTHASGLL